MSIDFVQEALKNLKPDNPDWYSWASTDSEGNVIPCEDRMCWEHTISIIDGVVKPTKSEFDAEVARLQAEYDSQAYARSRKAEYAQLNQFEMQFDDKRDGTTTWVDKINEIKARYPK
jgi:hypothetical protein